LTFCRNGEFSDIGLDIPAGAVGFFFDGHLARTRFRIAFARDLVCCVCCGPSLGAGIWNDPEPIRLGAGFSCVFVLAIFAGGLLAVLVKKLVAAVGLSPFDRVLGAGFGLIRGVLILMIAGVLVVLTPFKTSVLWRESVGASLITQIFKGLQPILPQEYGKYLR
jgi:hypothetical protein